MVSSPQAIRDEKALHLWFSRIPFVLVSFSGGVDSSLVLYAALASLGPAAVLAVLADSPLHKRRDAAAAEAFCRRRRIPLAVVETRELEIPGVRENPADRCYHCKKEILAAVAACSPVPGAVLVTGTNADDLVRTRPGLRAEAEAGARRPLAELNMGKKRVRALARRLGLETWNLPSESCLSTRIRRGEELTRRKLARVEAAEKLLEQAGFSPCRVRLEGDQAGLEVLPDRVRLLLRLLPDLEGPLLRLGFSRVEASPAGYVPGEAGMGRGA